MRHSKRSSRYRSSASSSAKLHVLIDFIITSFLDLLDLSLLVLPGGFHSNILRGHVSSLILIMCSNHFKPLSSTLSTTVSYGSIRLLISSFRMWFSHDIISLLLK